MMSNITYLENTENNITLSYNFSNNTQTPLDFLTFTHESRVEAIVYGVLFLLAAAGNVPVLISLIRNRHRKSRVQTMILHLAIADLIVTFIMIPLEVSWRITVEWIAGDAACRIMLFLRAFGPYLSSMVLVCISLDRYSAIVHPLRVNDAHRRAKIMLCFAWAISILCSVPQIMVLTMWWGKRGVKIHVPGDSRWRCHMDKKTQPFDDALVGARLSVIFHVERHPVHQNFEQCVSFNFFPAEYQKVTYNLFCIMALYGVPLLLIIFCYSRILWEIRMRSRRTNNTPNEGSQQTTGRLRLRLSDLSHIQRARTRTLKMTIIIVLTFFFCWTPYVIIDMWYLFDPTSAEALDPRIQTFLFMFAVSNSCVNPLVYGSYIFNFSAFLRRYLCCDASRSTMNRQSSAVTRFTQIDRVQVNGCLSQVAQEKLCNRCCRETHSAPDSYLELKHATPIRRPMTRRNLMGRESPEIAYSISSHSHSMSHSHSHSNRFSDDGRCSYD